MFATRKKCITKKWGVKQRRIKGNIEKEGNNFQFVLGTQWNERKRRAWIQIWQDWECIWFREVVNETRFSWSGRLCSLVWMVQGTHRW